MAASVGWFVRSVGTGLRERRRKMNALNKISDSARYARCIQTSKRVRWDLDEDVIRRRRFDAAYKFLPDGLITEDQGQRIQAALATLQ
jgi:hypothetical protein